ncbi:MAG TPA: hypothetical protein VJS91_04095 [Nitrososphaeraceae archaeon]|nr:hypothetical protein [Nitrososphaeraceae archaeon]
MTFILIFSTAIIIDSTIVEYISYSDTGIPISTNFWIFVFLSALLIVGNFILLSSIKRLGKGSFKKFDYFKKGVEIVIFSTNILLSASIVTVIMQMALIHKYNLVLLELVTYLSHITALSFLCILAFVFVGWLKSKGDYVLLMYTIAFLIIAAKIVLSLLYLDFFFSQTVSDFIKPLPINFVVTQVYPSSWSPSAVIALDFLTLCSFSLFWIATIVLLYEYRIKLGKIKYFILVGIPFIYYLFPFEQYLGNFLSPSMFNSPVAFGILYTLIFSGTKQIGSVLFSLAFWSTSTSISDDRVRKSMLISAIGMAILFGSIEISTLQYRLYPPYGLVTEGFMPLGTYLLFVGIFTSATFMAQDAKLRKELYVSAKKELSLLRTIGVTQMEKELVKKFKSIEKQAILSGRTEETYREEDDIKDLVREVLDELNKSKNIKKN